jgi:hypothetical protein
MVLPALTGQAVEHLGVQAMTWLVLASLVGTMAALVAMVRLRTSLAAGTARAD